MVYQVIGVVVHAKVTCIVVSEAAVLTSGAIRYADVDADWDVDWDVDWDADSDVDAVIWTSGSRDQ